MQITEVNNSLNIQPDDKEYELLVSNITALWQE